MNRHRRAERARARAAGWIALAALLAGAGAGAQVHGDPACSAAAPWPPRVHLAFEATAARGPLQLRGESDLTLSLAEGGYDLRTETRSLLYQARQTSGGRVGRDGLIPMRYVEQVLRREPRAAHFDWTARTVEFSANGAREPLRDLTQDRLSMLLQLGLLARSRPQAGGFEMPVAGVRRIGVYRIEARGEQVLDLPAGRWRTLGFARVTDDDHDAMEVWLAPDLCWLPVRMRFASERGIVVVNELREARFD